MGLMQGGEITVYIGSADAVSSACTAFTTYLDNFKESGGDKNVDDVPVFGGATLKNEKPRDQLEVSFDAVMQYDVGLLFDQLLMGSSLDGSTAVDSSMDAYDKVIYVEWTDGTTHYTRAYNNASPSSFQPEASADGYLKGTVTFKLSPTDSSGSGNKQVVKDEASSISW